MKRKNKTVSMNCTIHIPAKLRLESLAKKLWRVGIRITDMRLTPIAPAKSIGELLKEVEQLFHGETTRTSGCYDFHLGKFPHGWRFTVVNSWHRWSAANREHGFGEYPTAEQAVQAFLDYVKENRISVSGLMDH